jgi:hypothetical protein
MRIGDVRGSPRSTGRQEPDRRTRDLTTVAVAGLILAFLP